MGEVYEAYDSHRDRQVALKLLLQTFSGDQEYVKRFQRESHVAARLREPHVIPIHDFGEVDGRLFIDMRLVDGADIRTLLDSNGPIGPQRTVSLLSQVAQAVDAAHADGLVHRDIKPSNILVTASDFVYVVDFGIARSMNGQQTSLTITGATIGTLDYMAPERFIGREVDGRADIYSLACVLHECLTATPPFAGRDLPSLMYAHLNSDPPRASTIIEGVPAGLDDVVARGMAKEPADRFATAGELVAAAQEALAGAAASAAAGAAPAVVLAPAAAASAVVLAPAPAPREAPAAEVGGDASLAEVAAPASAPAPASQAQAGAAVVDRPAEAKPESERPAAKSAGQQSLAPGDRPTVSGPLPRSENPPPSASPASEAGPPPGAPTGEPGREPAWRRRGLQVLAGLVAVGVVIALVVVFTGRKPGGSTKPGPAAPPADASLATPKFAGKTTIGKAANSVTITPDGKYAYVADQDENQLAVLSTATGKPVKTIAIPQGAPQFISFSPDGGTAYVSIYNNGGYDADSDKVHLVDFVDTATGQVTASVQVNNQKPGPTLTGPGGQYLYVSTHNMTTGVPHQNDVDVIDTASHRLVGAIPVAMNPHGIVFGKGAGANYFYTSGHMMDQVTVVNAQTNKVVREISVGETPHGEAISPTGRQLAVTSWSGSEVFLVSTKTDRQTATIPVGTNPQAAAYSADGRHLYVVNNQSDSVSVIDTADNRVTATIPTGKAPTSIAVLPNGKQAYVADQGDGTVEILNLTK
ncbi:MAG: protein kinase [Actinobacteria bacterium]|nr:protein kinase [Actinomycetota bacterium]